MKIAICISGCIRTGRHAADSIVKYFGQSGDVDYFYHTWSTNAWGVDKKIENWNAHVPIDSIDVQDLKAINHIYRPIYHQIDDMSIVNQYKFKYGVPWRYMLYSMMMANELKRVHEETNGFRYDVVVKTRFDLLFHPRCKFNRQLGYLGASRPSVDMRVFTDNVEVFPREFSRPNLNDITFWGSSQAMDVACEYFRYVSLYPRVPADVKNGPGVGLYKYLQNNSIRVIEIPSPWDFQILRPEGVGVIHDWNEVGRIAQSYH